MSTCRGVEACCWRLAACAVLLALLLTTLPPAAAVLLPATTPQINLGGSKFKVWYTIAGDSISFIFSCQGTGWCSMGLNSVASMAGMDSYTGWAAHS